MPSLRRINVVFLYVRDMECACRFYEDVVGFGPPSIRTEEWVEYRLEGGAHFALHRTTPEALEGCDPARNTLHFSIVVDDLRRAYEELKAKGVEFRRPPEQGHGFELAEFVDPEGNPVRLIQYLPNGPTT